MLHYYAKNAARNEFEEVSAPQYHDAWVHGESVSLEEIEEVSKHAGLNANIVHDVTDKNELPRVEHDGDDLYVFTRVPSKNSRGEVISSPLLSIVTKSSFITISHHGNLSANELLDVKLKAKQEQPINLLINSIAHVVQSYEVLIQQTGEHVREIGRKLQKREVTNSDFVRFVTIEDNLNEYKINLDSLLSIAQRLGDNAHKSFHPSDIEALSDVRLHIQELGSATAGYNQSVSSIRNAYSTIANNTLNQRMKILTLLTVLIALPNVVYGMYGMNVALPFQREPWAYTAISTFTIVVVLTVFMLVKRFRVL